MSLRQEREIQLLKERVAKLEELVQKTCATKPRRKAETPEQKAQ